MGHWGGSEGPLFASGHSTSPNIGICGTILTSRFRPSPPSWPSVCRYVVAGSITVNVTRN